MIPPEKNIAYMAIYYAWMGLTGGIAPLLAGGILSFNALLQMQFGAVRLDGYGLLFLLSLALLVYGLAEYGRVAQDGVNNTRAAVRK